MVFMVEAILSWFVRNPYSNLGKIYVALNRFTEPIVAPCRRFLSRFNTGPMDFSLILAFFLVEAVANILIRLLYLI